MKPRSDFHVHTRVSGCCKEDYGVLDAWAKGRDRGIERLGITDHDVPFKNKFIAKHVEHAKDHDGLLVGLEVTIRDGKGGIQVAKSVLNQLDYLVLSEHVHVMPFYTIFKRARSQLEAWWTSESQRQLIDRFYERHAAMTVSAINHHRPDILAHPWRFPWHRGLLDTATIDACEPVLAAAARAGSRIEFSRIVMALIGRDLDGTATVPDLPAWQGQFDHRLDLPAPFFTRFFAACKEHGVRLTLGSDAHKLADVGAFPDLERAMSACGVTGSMIDQDIGSRRARR